MVSLVTIIEKCLLIKIDWLDKLGWKEIKIRRWNIPKKSSPKYKSGGKHGRKFLKNSPLPSTPPNRRITDNLRTFHSSTFNPSRTKHLPTQLLPQNRSPQTLQARYYSYPQTKIQIRGRELRKHNQRANGQHWWRSVPTAPGTKHLKWTIWPPSQTERYNRSIHSTQICSGKRKCKLTTNLLPPNWKLGRHLYRECAKVWHFMPMQRVSHERSAAKMLTAWYFTWRSEILFP